MASCGHANVVACAEGWRSCADGARWDMRLLACERCVRERHKRHIGHGARACVGSASHESCALIHLSCTPVWREREACGVKSSNVRHLTFDIRPSAFGIQWSTFDVRNFTFNVRRETFEVQHGVKIYSKTCF